MEIKINDNNNKNDNNKIKDINNINDNEFYHLIIFDANNISEKKFLKDPKYEIDNYDLAIEY